MLIRNYLNWSTDIEQDCYGSALFITYCGPTVYDVPAMDKLYRNNGDGTFTDVTVAAGINVAFGNGLGTVGADFNGDGNIDILAGGRATHDVKLYINQTGK